MAGAAVLVVAGAAVASATGDSSTSLCVSDGQQVTAAKADASGVYGCPAGRTLVVLARASRLEALRDDVGRLFVEVDRVEQRVSERLGLAESQLGSLEDATASHDGRLGGLEADRDASRSDLDDARARLATLEQRVTAVEQRTTVSTRTATASFATTSTPRTTVGCGTGAKALSGSARAVDATVAQSSVTDDGASWTFDLRSTGKTPSASLLVVCSGASTTAPAPGSGPTSPTAPGVEPAPAG